MANLIITDLGSSINIKFNTSAQQAGGQEIVWRKDHIKNLILSLDSSFVIINMDDGTTWEFAHAGVNHFIVDKVGLIQPASVQNLYDLLKALL